MKNTKPIRNIATKADANELLASLSHWVNNTEGGSFEYVTDPFEEHRQLDLMLKVTVTTEPEIGSKLFAALELMEEGVVAAYNTEEVALPELAKGMNRLDPEKLYNDVLDAMLIYYRTVNPSQSYSRLDMVGYFTKKHKSCE